jgi:hypothetical protein
MGGVLCPPKYSFFLQRLGGLQRISLKGNHAGGELPARQHWKNIKSYGKKHEKTNH